jgi:hypothetical protein
MGAAFTNALAIAEKLGDPEYQLRTLGAPAKVLVNCILNSNAGGAQHCPRSGDGARPLTVHPVLRLPQNTAECPPAGGYIARRPGPMWLARAATSRRNTSFSCRKRSSSRRRAMRRLQCQRSNHANDLAVHAWGHAQAVRHYPVVHLHWHRRDLGGVYRRLCHSTESKGAGQRPSPPSRRTLFQVEVASTNASCCNGKETTDSQSTGDCYPTTAKVRAGSWWAERDDGQWVIVPDDRILRERNPDVERAHLCFCYGRALCFVPPSTGT